MRFEIIELNLEDCLSTLEFDPSPHRLTPSETPVSERQNMPLRFHCNKCGKEIAFTLDNFKTHTNLKFTNLNQQEIKLFEVFLQQNNIKSNSLIDFYCPGCNRATLIIFDGGPSGYWGMFRFKVEKFLAIEEKK